MSQQYRDDSVIRQIEGLLRLLRIQRVGDIGVTRQGVRPIRTWDEQTKHLRFADKVKLHRYPGGLANTTRWRRDRMVAAHRQRVAGCDDSVRVELAAIHEAVAYAVDAERFLGSLDQRNERDYFPVEAVDALAENLIAWLEERGYHIGPLEEV